MTSIGTVALQVQTLSTAQAQCWFDAMPAAQRIISLSPRFAAADAARVPGLRCMHLGIADGTSRWLDSIHLRAMPQDHHGAQSPYGYGGALAIGCDGAWLRAAWRAYSAWCEGQKILAEFRRFHPHMRSEGRFGGTVRPNRMTVSIDLRLTMLDAQYNALARRKIRHGLAHGVAARWSESEADWARFAVFYREAMRALDAASGYLFPDAYFEALRQVPGVRLCICVVDAQWLSAGVYLFGAEVAEYHLGANSARGQDAGSPYLLQHVAAQEAAACGAGALYLGGGTDPREDNPLLFYKKCFSRWLLPFSVGHAIHDEATYWDIAEVMGHDRQHPPERILMD